MRCASLNPPVRLEIGAALKRAEMTWHLTGWSRYIYVYPTTVWWNSNFSCKDFGIIQLKQPPKKQIVPWKPTWTLSRCALSANFQVAVECALDSLTSLLQVLYAIWMKLCVITWKAKCPIFKAIVAGFRGKVALKNRTLRVPGMFKSNQKKTFELESFI